MIVISPPGDTTRVETISDAHAGIEHARSHYDATPYTKLYEIEARAVCILPARLLLICPITKCDAPSSGLSLPDGAEHNARLVDDRHQCCWPMTRHQLPLEYDSQLSVLLSV